MLLEKLLEAPGGADWRPLGTPGGSWGAAGDSWRLPEAPVQQRQSLHALGAPEVLGEQDQSAAGWGPRERRPLDLFTKHLWSADWGEALWRPGRLSEAPWRLPEGGAGGRGGGSGGSLEAWEALGGSLAAP